MKIAVFTKMFGDRRLDEVIDVASNLDYDAVEVMCREPHFGVETSNERARDIADRLDANDLEVACLATYTGKYVGKSEAECEAALDRLTRFLELGEILDCPRVRHGPGGPPSRDADDDAYRTGAKWMRRAADVAADYDATLLMEIHSNTIIESAADAERLLDAIGRENVGVIHDAGNMYISDVGYGRESVERLGDDLRHVHVKDERRCADSGPEQPGRFELETCHGVEAFEPRLLGTGDVDHAPLFEALAERGYDGYITAECHRPPDDARSATDIARHERAEIERSWEHAQST
ncbi:sugar phosphate isomerase/epimerase [Haladaptatus sp. AB618]|uniref:sugar phosphate isomerase/epimerase family protein n=1 Tax=Haladaptatus sp. AB618 TaxID=2934173 RepID=UPI00209C6410|nr:sugar phosphate isomerase/epimerase [Haladaptatus sp. AB618]MCO8254957.1 sugar phosphate isomerase/epimerase [Haladaptatus sp. AB618]